MAARTDDDFFRGCPAEYKELLAHIDELQFADAPGYAILTGILEKVKTGGLAVVFDGNSSHSFPLAR
jgi:hypothetical protein